MEIKQQSSVLVTGANGFVGRAVTRLLERSVQRVVALDVNPETLPSSESATKVVCDISCKDDLAQIFEEHHIDRIVHLAAVLPTAAQKDPSRTTRVNVTGGLNVMEMAAQFGVRRMVFGSSLSVYGSCPPDRVISESDPAAPEDLYGAAKLYVEQLGLAYAVSHALEFVSLRIGRVVAPGAQSATSAWRSQIFEFLRTGHPATITLSYVGSERILLIHLDEVTQMLVTLLQTPRPQHAVYNAQCESVVVSDLKEQVESLNPNILVTLGNTQAIGNPRLLDSSRFQREFGFVSVPMAERLRAAAENEHSKYSRSSPKRPTMSNF
jgi:nucleoside-diphosphate-sugar epimerase